MESLVVTIDEIFYHGNHGGESPFIELHRIFLEPLALAEAVGKVAARTRMGCCTAIDRLERTRISPRTAIDRPDQHPSMTKFYIVRRYINTRDALIGMFTESMLLGKRSRSRSRSALMLTQAQAYSGLRLT